MTTPKATKLVGYIRVSTKRQGDSGLGLEGQVAAINSYAAQCSGEIVATYREVESGKKNDRPQLAKAIEHAKRIRGSRLVIAKLDRLARSVHFVSGLMESKIDFVACDNPYGTPFSIHIYAAVAEEEARKISERTKAALAAVKARGGKLGSARAGHWDGRENIRLAAAAKARKKAAALYKQASAIYDQIRPLVRTMRAELKSLQAIADKLNQDGFTTIRGLQWNRMQVNRLCGA